MNEKHQVLVALSERALQSIALLKPFLFEGRYLLCEKVETGEPHYLRVRAAVVEDTERFCELQIPHTSVDFLWIDVPDRTIGFSHAAQPQHRDG